MIKNDFSEKYILYANETNEVNKKEIIKNLNNLESSDNYYKAIFDCNTLTEGWDVKNLFDIVRLYETRQGDKAESTISEAQLIGRGARYFPFVVDGGDTRLYTRKFSDNDKNPLYYCETLFYHCYNDESYISELRAQLREQGFYNFDEKKERIIKLKREFKNSKFYNTGYLFHNNLQEREKTEYKVSDLYNLFPSDVDGYLEGASSENLMCENKTENKKYESKKIKIKEIAKSHYFLLRKLMIGQNKFLRFDKLKEKYPNLETLRDFITKDEYLGDFSITIKTQNNELNFEDFNIAMKYFFKVVNDVIRDEKKYYGTKKFVKEQLKIVIGDEYTLRIDDNDDSKNCGLGVSQMDERCAYYKKKSNSQLYPMQIKNLNTCECDWYVFEDNIGTTEKKAFVYEFSKKYKNLEKYFSYIRLIRNEKKLKLYKFDDGIGFEPDFILILKKNENDKTCIQIFFEPKGKQLMLYDESKDKFLFAINKSEGFEIEKIKGQNNIVKGAPFFNMEYDEVKKFDAFIDKLIEDYG